uniref:Bromo domain-containing protein n=1 Tax=Globodera pallida TaxID=36090 RepID=A0A183CL70_GLOPA
VYMNQQKPLFSGIPFDQNGGVDVDEAAVAAESSSAPPPLEEIQPGPATTTTAVVVVDPLKRYAALRRNFERVRLLCELVKKRERMKHEQLLTNRAIVCKTMKPLAVLIDQTLAKLIEKDHQKIFAQPVTEKQVPGYFATVSRPMDFKRMGANNEKGRYKRIADLRDDFLLMIQNCTSFNKDNLWFYNYGQRFKRIGMSVIKAAEIEEQRMNEVSSMVRQAIELPILSNEAYINLCFEVDFHNNKTAHGTEPMVDTTFSEASTELLKDDKSISHEPTIGDGGHQVHTASSSLKEFDGQPEENKPKKTDRCSSVRRATVAGKSDAEALGRNVNKRKIALDQGAPRVPSNNNVQNKYMALRMNVPFLMQQKNNSFGGGVAAGNRGRGVCKQTYASAYQTEASSAAESDSGNCDDIFFSSITEEEELSSTLTERKAAVPRRVGGGGGGVHKKFLEFGDTFVSSSPSSFAHNDIVRVDDSKFPGRVIDIRMRAIDLEDEEDDDVDGVGGGRSSFGVGRHFIDYALATKPKENETGQQPFTLILFFDKNSTCKWVPNGQIRLLYELDLNNALLHREKDQMVEEAFERARRFWKKIFYSLLLCTKIVVFGRFLLGAEATHFFACTELSSQHGVKSATEFPALASTAATENDVGEEAAAEGVISSSSATRAALEEAEEDDSESSEDEEEDSTDSDEWDKKRRKMQMRARRQRVQKWKINNNSQTKQKQSIEQQPRCDAVQKKISKAINEAMACSSGTSVVMSNNNNIQMSRVAKLPRNLAEMRQYTNVPKAIIEPMACSSGTSVVMSNNNSNNIEESGVAKTPRNLAEMLKYTNVVSANLGKKSSLLTPSYASNAGPSSVGTAAVTTPRLPPPSKSIATLITDRFRPNRLSFYGRTSFPTTTPRAVPVHTIRLSNNVNAQGRNPSTTTFDATLGDVVARQMTQMPSLVPAIASRPNATTSFWPTPSSSTTNAQHNLLLAASADGETAALLDNIGAGATKQSGGYRGDGTALVEQDVVVLDSDEEEENNGTGAATAAEHLQQQDSAESAPFCKNCSSEIPLILQSLDRLDGIVTLMTSAVEAELMDRRRISRLEPAATNSNATAAITTTTIANEINVPAASSYFYTVQTQILDQQLSKLNGGIGDGDGIQNRLLQSSEMRGLFSVPCHNRLKVSTHWISARRTASSGATDCTSHDWLSETCQLIHRSKLPTYHFQKSLFRLPVPDLAQSCDRYVDAVGAVFGAHSKEVADTNALVQDFTTGGTKEGRTLQKELKRYAKQNKHTSYISEPWFDMYLGSRVSCPINFNPFMMFAPDPDPSYNDQLIRATNLVISCGRFKKAVTPKHLKGLSPTAIRWLVAAVAFKAYPLDMSQYQSLFGGCRIPQRGKDRLHHNRNSKHFVVAHQGNFYAVKLFDQNDMLVTPKQIFASISHICNCAKSVGNKSDTNDEGVGSLTTLDRDSWADIRSELLGVDSKNQESLSAIEDGLFLLCLDDLRSTDPERLMYSLLCGDDGSNRWFDKCFQLIVDGNGQATINFEHSWGDGVAVLRLMEETLKDTTNNLRKLDWHLNDTLRQKIRNAQKSHLEQSQKLGFGVVQHTALSKEAIKKAKLSPDAMMQLAFQLAFHSIYGNFVPTYESCSTAAFLKGRTECVRSSTSATRAAVEAFEALDKNGAGGGGQMRSFLRDCSDKHFKLVKEASMGKGFDRHFFGLRLAAERLGLEPHPLFTHPVYESMNHFVLSTSTLSTDTIYFGGFGPVVPDGIGIGYNVTDTKLGAVAIAYNPSFLWWRSAAGCGVYFQSEGLLVQFLASQSLSILAT